MTGLEFTLRKVKQDVFNEMVEGNGRQPAEVVDQVIYALIKIYPEKAAELREVLNFYPDYEIKVDPVIYRELTDNESAAEESTWD